MIRKLQFTVSKEFAGKPVLNLLKANRFSSRVIKEIKRTPRGLLIGNKKATVLKTLKEGDVITVYIHDKSSENVVASDIPLDILYEDKDVMVVNKPPFMATHPSQDNYDTSLANAIAFHLKKKGENCTVRPVNRLDKNTSGLILIAKNAHASGILSNDLKVKKIQREYLAFVEGVPPEVKGKIDAPIARAPGSTIARCVDFEKGERAITNYRVLRAGEFSLVRLKLETGRTHQIRVHMSHIGCAVAGDFLYGTEFSGGIKRHALHSYTLSFTHPVTNTEMAFTAPLPDDMKQIYTEQWGTFDETSCI